MKCKIYFNSSDVGLILEMENTTFKKFYDSIRAEKSGLIFMECKTSTIFNTANISHIVEIYED